MEKKIVVVIEEKIYGINGYHIKIKEDVKNHVIVEMSKRKEKTNRKLEILNEINHIDKRLKKAWRKDDLEEKSKLRTKRNTLRSKLKTKR